MNNHLKGILLGSFVLLVILLLLSKCTSCRDERPNPPTPDEPRDTVAYAPQEIFEDTIAPEPEPEPEPEPQPTPEPEPIQVDTSRGEDGDIRVTIEWAFAGDVDLHVFEPSNFEVSFMSMRSPSGGFLDVDNREGGTRRNTAVENAYWSNPPTGIYRVDLVMYRISEYAPNGGNVNVRIKNGSDVRTYQVRLSRQSQRVTVTTFAYNGRRSN